MILPQPAPLASRGAVLAIFDMSWPVSSQDSISAINLMEVSAKLAHVRKKHQVRPPPRGASAAPRCRPYARFTRHDQDYFEITLPARERRTLRAP
jgi:hypothetical protein